MISDKRSGLVCGAEYDSPGVSPSLPGSLPDFADSKSGGESERELVNAESSLSVWVVSGVIWLALAGGIGFIEQERFSRTPESSWL